MMCAGWIRFRDIARRRRSVSIPSMRGILISRMAAGILQARCGISDCRSKFSMRLSLLAHNGWSGFGLAERQRGNRIMRPVPLSVRSSVPALPPASGWPLCSAGIDAPSA
jgi:hypothetical protein